MKLQKKRKEKSSGMFLLDGIKEKKVYPQDDLRKCPQTPWGRAENCLVLQNGIKWYDTPSHGGFYVGIAQGKKMPKQYFIECGWYEEDCDCWKVVLAFPEFFSKSGHRMATERFKEFFNPDGTDLDLADFKE